MQVPTYAHTHMHMSLYSYLQISANTSRLWHTSNYLKIEGASTNVRIVNPFIVTGFELEKLLVKLPRKLFIHMYEV